MTLVKIQNYRIQQQGMGLVEVLVALLLLAIAALGYSALQMQALSTSDEAITRTQAQTILRDFSERIRTTGTTDAVLNIYETKVNTTTIASTVCSTTSSKADCLNHQVATDIAALRSQAVEEGVTLGMVKCPGTASQAQTRCLIAAWNSTTPTKGNSSTDCMNDEGVYIFNADCVYMEAY